MEMADKSRTKGTEEVPTMVDPPRARGGRLVLGAGMGKPQIVGTVAGRATRRVSVGRSVLIRTNPDSATPDRETGKARTM